MNNVMRIIPSEYNRLQWRHRGHRKFIKILALSIDEC